VIVIKSPEEIGLMRECGSILSEMLQQLRGVVRPGIRTRDLDEFVEAEMKRRDVVASFKGYGGYPASVCVSVNDEIVHGIPGSRTVKEGDIVSLDLGVYRKGFHTDAALTLAAGQPSPEAERLIRATEECLAKGIDAARPGNHVGDISVAIQRHIESQGFSIVREYTGHGVGRELHEEPQIPNFACGKGPLLRKGMALAIEPMVNMGGWKTRVAPDKWTVLTADGSLSAHFEHTIVITDGDPEVLA
jgi:methionyl aminopeptidase